VAPASADAGKFIVPTADRKTLWYLNILKK
jgi:hypothetical protein